MVFWGVEVKPGEQFTPSGDEGGEYEGCRLHLSQATLGLDAKGKERTVVKCKVGDGPELLLCSLTPGVSESCFLDLLFDQDVVFSVAGSTSVHLVGYYMPLDDDDEEDDDYEFEGSEFDSEDDLDDDDDEDSDMDERYPLDAPPSSVTITELDDDAARGKFPVKNKQKRDSDEDDKKANKKRKKAASSKDKMQSSKELENVTVDEVSEDEDGFPRPSEKSEAVTGSEQGFTTSTSDEPKKQKKKKKNKNEKIQTQVEEIGKTPKTAEAVDKTPNTAGKESGSEVKSSAKGSAENGSTVTSGTDTIGKKLKKSGPLIRKFPNGLEIEEIAMGRPDARQTRPGKRVTVHYTGRLKTNGKIFDSSIGKKPFVFRLGVGEVVKGWDVGVAGMRIGDKRRITIPPAMGYGAKGSGPIPGNSWLVFDVDVVDVAK
ncbi:unnamed protein product [Calypogeia fissa]